MSIKNRLYDLLATNHCRSAMLHVNALEQQLVTPEQRFELPFRFRGSGHFRTLRPKQNEQEIRGLYERVLALAPQRVLEIGTGRGGTLYLWTQAATDDATIITIDLPGGEFGGAYEMCRAPLYRAFARAGQSLYLRRGDSHDPASRDAVQRLFGGEPIDFAFIDGDHTYEGVRRDVELYAPLVREGGLIAFHDILPRPDAPSIQVDRLWTELRARYDGEELVGDETSGRQIGIGVIQVPRGGVVLEEMARA